MTSTPQIVNSVVGVTDFVISEFGTTEDILKILLFTIIGVLFLLYVLRLFRHR